MSNNRIEIDYREQIIEQVSEKIAKVISDMEGWVSVDGVSYDVIVKACEKAGLDVDDNYPDTNGWEVDYWQTAWDSEGRKFYISGSMYWGDHTIGVDED